MVTVTPDPTPSQAQAAGHAAPVGQARESDVAGSRHVVPVRTLVYFRGGGRGEHTAQVVGDRRRERDSGRQQRPYAGGRSRVLVQPEMGRLRSMLYVDLKGWLPR